MVAVQERIPGSQLIQAISDRFVESSEGYWYPRGPGVPLVRVRINGGIYRIDRRRDENTEWIRLVEGVVSDFDAASFATWADAFELVKH